ncbi:hypothetical protein LCGC14_1517390 [marine sediment metagenome]|uniref:Uncharacterized protein n=1 Tax=marine sediment metagenome TaxID=412755 RepID=A0A0F9IZP5_9ZZZZ
MERQAPEKPPEDKHSPRPWKARPDSYCVILDANGMGIAVAQIDFLSYTEAQANRDLIIDAVNGQKALEESHKRRQDIIDQYHKLLVEERKDHLEVKAQRDELVNMCENAYRYINSFTPEADMTKFREALDKIKEGLDTETIYKTKGG